MTYENSPEQTLWNQKLVFTFVVFRSYIKQHIV